MNCLRFGFGRFGLGVAVLAGAGVVSARASADLTGAQVLERCQKAYGAIKTYRGTSNVVTKSDIGGAKMTFNTSAKVQFVRPGKIRVAGTLMLPGGKFEFVSDGKQTWQTSALTQSKWEKAQSTEMAIAAFTGVSQMAATSIPAALLNVMGGARFGVVNLGKASRTTLDGRQVYRIDAKSAMGGMSLWIDQKSFLLVKKFTHNDLSNFKMPEGVKPPNMPNMPTSGVTDVTETFSGVRVNGVIPASVFVRPAGMKG
jgi:hypothetical protein